MNPRFARLARRPPLKLRGKVMAIVVCVLLAAVAAVAGANILRIAGVRDTLRDVLAEKALTIAKDIRSHVNENLKWFKLANVSGMTPFLGAIPRENPGVVYAFVANTERTILFHSTQERVGAQLDPAIYTNVPTERRFTSRRIRRDAAFEVAIPIIDADAVVGTIHVGIDRDLIAGRLDAMVRDSVIVLVLSLVLGTLLIGTLLEAAVVRPIIRLAGEAQRISDSRDLSVRVGIARGDEVGTLASSFDVMIESLQQYYRELADTNRELSEARAHLAEWNEILEARVEARTRELAAKSDELARANEAYESGIAYASLLQHALLPEADSLAGLGRHAVVWWPRDVVGGDIYVARPMGAGAIAGVADCTGHGVPGAFMSMAAYAAFDHAMESMGASSPARVLTVMDDYLRRILAQEVTTGADDGAEMALITWDGRGTHALFAGAGIDLFVVDPPEDATALGRVERLRGAKAGLGQRRQRGPAGFADRPVAIRPGRCFVILSDGVLDHVGGPQGRPFGRKRLERLLAETAGAGPTQQRDQIVAALQAWQGDEPQRDDLTLLALAPSPQPAQTARRENQNSYSDPTA